MRIHRSANRESGLTLVEVMVVLVLLVLIGILFLIPPLHREGRSPRIQCVNNLKQCALAFRVWEGDHGDKYPMEVVETNGGTAEYIMGPNLWRHFQVMSNELSTGHVLICPSDSRLAATNFAYLRNSNISYFVGVDARETNSAMIFAGDHNLTNGLPLKNCVLEVTTNRATGWTSEMHNGCGNLAFADGHVDEAGSLNIRSIVANTGVATNRLQMPVLTP